jgi:hypothetical protein
VTSGGGHSPIAVTPSTALVRYCVTGCPLQPFLVTVHFSRGL